MALSDLSGGESRSALMCLRVIPCYKIVLMFYNGLRIKNRFNVFYTLLAVVTDY